MMPKEGRIAENLFLSGLEGVGSSAQEEGLLTS